jgi:ankyrin repeat protein
MSTSRLKICLVFFVVFLAAMYNFMYSSATNSAVQELQLMTEQNLVSTATSQSNSIELLPSHLSDEVRVKKPICDNDKMALYQSTVIYTKALLRKSSLTFKEKLTNEGFSRFKIESAVQLVGIDLRLFRRTSAVYDYNYRSLLPINAEILRLTAKQKNFVMKSMISGNYSEIISNASIGQLTNNHILAGDPLLSALILANAKIEPSTVEQLIDAGLTPGFADLVKLSSNKQVPAATIKLLESFNQALLSTTWFANYQDYNLTMLAAQMLDIDLLELWINRGVAAYANQNDFTAMDMVAVPQSSDDKIKAIKVFELLATKNVMPYDIATIGRLKQWLPQDIINQYDYYFEQYQMPSISREDAQSSRQFKLAMTDIIEQLNGTENNLAKCQQLINQNKVITPVKPSSTTPKMDDLDEATQKLAFKLLNALNNKDWQRYLEAFHRLPAEIDENELLNLILLQAIQSNAPYKQIIALIERGAQLDESVIFILAMRKNIFLANNLYPYGLNLHAIDNEGRSALEYAIIAGGSEKMLAFLLQSGVKIRSDDDLLGFVLSKEHIKNKVVYAKLLIDFGHAFTERHSIELKTIELNDKVEYSQLAILFGI